MYYLIKSTLEKTEALDFSKKTTRFVAVLTSAEWLDRSSEFDMGIEMDLDLSQIHSTKAEVNYDSLTGTFFIPDREHFSAPNTGFAFALDEKGIVLIDDSGLASQLIDRITASKRWARPSLERFLYDFLEQIVSGDQAILERYDQELDTLESEILAGSGTDDDELARRKKTISYGVEQVKRRVKLVQKDWDKIKANADIELPDKPYDEEHIIKIVCTDVGNYTGLESEGVILTDYATVIKYFKNPYVHGLKRDQVQHLELVQKQVLWEKGHPTANEFIQYLHNPDTMSLFIDCLKPEWKLIPVFGEYKHIAFQDMIVKEDPIKKFAAKQGFS